MSSVVVTGTTLMTRPAGLAAWYRDFALLSKPKIGVMVLVAATVGHLLGSEGVWHWDALLPTLSGLFLAVACSSILNQVLESRTDGLMRRTANRPLPAGRISVWEATIVGVAAGIAGCGILLLFVNLLTAALTALSILLYVLVYTPLKSRSSVCTIIGAVPGALPPLLGWTAATGRIDTAAVVLFGVLFLWQFPHFLAIAWRLRDDYHAAGLHMMPWDGRNAALVGCIAVGYAVVLIPVSLLPSVLGLGTAAYAVVALALGLMYLAYTLKFAWEMSTPSARRLMWVSLVYLPVLLVALCVDHQRGLSFATVSLEVPGSSLAAADQLVSSPSPSESRTDSP